MPRYPSSSRTVAIAVVFLNDQLTLRRKATAFNQKLSLEVVNQEQTFNLMFNKKGPTIGTMAPPAQRKGSGTIKAVTATSGSAMSKK